MSEKKEETGQSLEETFMELDALIAQMEQPGQSLDESFRLYLFPALSAGNREAKAL